MQSLTELYKSIYEKLNSIFAEYSDAQERLTGGQKIDAVTREKRINKLQELLKKIEDVKEKVEYFTAIAEQHITSRNLLTITPREVDFRRLRDWTTLIDATNNDDPHAQRVYVLSKCNLMYLEEKRAKFEEELDSLKNEHGMSSEELTKEVEAIKKRLNLECSDILTGDDFSALAEGLKKLHARYSEIENISAVFETKLAENEKIGLGVYARPLPVLPDVKYLATEKLGNFYGTKTNSILWPVEIPEEKETVVTVSCDPAKEKRMYRGFQNYLLNIIARSAAGNKKIQILDALHYNNSCLGMLKTLESTMLLEAIPKDVEGIMDALKMTVASFTDIDEQLGIVDSVEEYNKTAEPEKSICRRVMVLIGYPFAFPSEARQLVNRILLNREHYGISVILVNTNYAAKNSRNENRVEDELAEGIVRIKPVEQKEQVSINSGKLYNFAWYELKNELPASLIEKVRAMESKNKKLGTEYVKRVDMENIPPYVRGSKKLSLPYGVDQMDNVHSISFDNENFASYLMGASGSGKSTLLHTIITGILRNYHPDDVELWLADFKMSEFAQYINPMPPHVKYILLDESPELVYDLLDKLTEKMMERQRFFMRHKEMKKVENVPSTIYMPVIFVILDEFSIMSQSVSESETYKLKLQNLLAKGRALGIKFIFSSQTFTKGVAGLTQTAKDQIQTRIAMKNSYNEINETLELSSATRTEQVKNWMEALPPHFTLSKYRDGERLQVKRLQVMYFKGKGDEALEPQRKMIRHLNETMHKVAIDEYNNTVLDAYVDKEPVVVDGNSYRAFNGEKIGALISGYRKAHGADLADDDTVLTFGAPRQMANAKFAVLSNESRENLLLIAHGAEQACASSIIMSAVKQFALQGGQTEIWAYSKNRLYRAYKPVFKEAEINVVEGLDDICDAISNMKEAIKSKEAANKLIVLIGFEHICMDFDYITSSNNTVSKSGTRTQDTFNEGAVATREDQIKKTIADAFEKEWKPIEAQLKKEGKAELDIRTTRREFMREFKSRNTVLYQELQALSSKTQVVRPPADAKAEIQRREPVKERAYNAKGDFEFIVKQGSRKGYHFLLALNNFSDLKPCGLKAEYFRYRLAFQLSTDDSRTVFNSKIASSLPEHICQFDDGLERYSFRPYLHTGIDWDGWMVDENGVAVSSYGEE